MNKKIIYQIILFASIIANAIYMIIRLRRLFLPTVNEIIGVLSIHIILFLISIALLIFSNIASKAIKTKKVEEAKLQADSYYKAYSYSDVIEALNARVGIWESETTEKNFYVSRLKVLISNVKNLEKMSSDFYNSFDELLHKVALDAVKKIDNDKLKALSNFVSYCSNATEYELTSHYFGNVCDKIDIEIKETLEVYASMRATLGSYDGDDADYEMLKQEITNIIESN